MNVEGASGEDYIWSVDHDNDASSDDNIYVVPDKRMDGETDRRLDEQTDGQTDKQTNKDNIFYIQGNLELKFVKKNYQNCSLKTFNSLYI